MITNSTQTQMNMLTLHFDTPVTKSLNFPTQWRKGVGGMTKILCHGNNTHLTIIIFAENSSKYILNCNTITYFLII